KAFDANARAKYFWVNGQPDTGADIYNLEACKSTEEIWLLEGEPDVWIASQAGIAAVSLTCGAVQHATNRMQRGLEELVASGVRVVNICYDNDDAGRITAEVVGRMLAQKGIDARIRLLTSPLVPEKGDITDLYRQIAQDDTALRLALDQLPVQIDRKSTRLNSSHVKISYAVFCL